jgi:hypothetical protein
MVLSRSHPPQPSASDAATRPIAGPARTGTATCLLTPLHSERSLSLALLQHLAEELPDLDFTLEDQGEVDVLWVCGYERGNSELIRGLREHHPLALLLVTAREPEELWSAEVRAAGADVTLGWPMEVARVGRVIRRRARLHH